MKATKDVDISGLEELSEKRTGVEYPYCELNILSIALLVAIARIRDNLPESHLEHEKRDTDQEKRQQVRDKESTASELDRERGEAPHIAKANRRANPVEGRRKRGVVRSQRS